ncbi:MAG: penicillin-binding protein [Francisellaceae bacterium]|nr:penicillin-binding protein [Francisellaceae bacterium]
MKALFSILSNALMRTFFITALVGLGTLLYLEANLPSVDSLKEVHLQVPLKVYSSDNKLIAEFGEKRRIPVKLKDVPFQLIQAILATEDRRFYEHQGVDFRGIARAAVHLLTKASKEQGGSTITMQVARNLFLTRKKTFIRKINEILLALKIEQELTKDEILELYLNVIYLGKRAYGVAAAAEVYYGQALQDLSLSQMAMIAGLPQAPSAINPLQSPEAALKRRKHVLDRMLQYEYINESQYKEALYSPLEAKYHGKVIELNAPYVAEMVRQEMEHRYGKEATSMGYEVYTSVNSHYQQAANDALEKALLEYDRRHGYRKPTLQLKLGKFKNTDEAIAKIKQTLKDLPSFGSLHPAVVTGVFPDKITCYSKNHQIIDIHWKNMSWAAPQLKNYRVGNPPKQASEIVELGDQIYIQAISPNEYRLSQVPEAEAALVALDPKNGDILALVGGFNYQLSHFNRVLQADRQPGSTFKPFIYAAALSEGFTLASVVNDAPFVYYDPISGPWRPKNDKNRFLGPLRLRKSLAKSQNTVTIRLLQTIGIKKMVEYAKQFGFNTNKLPPYLSMALGSGNVTPLELANAYCIFANGGYRISSQFINVIKDEHGKTLFEAQKPYVCQDCILQNPELSHRALSPSVAFLMNSALQDAIKSGTGQKALSLGRSDLAGKTGTTNDKLDAWYSGFNQDIVATAWVGFDDPRTLKEYGSQAALPLWMYFMEQALKDKPEKPFLLPAGITSVRIDPATGLLAHPNQPDAIFEYFDENTIPSIEAPLNYQEINSETGRKTSDESLF